MTSWHVDLSARAQSLIPHHCTTRGHPNLLCGAAGLHHASLAVRRQALSKRATYSSISQQPAAVDASLLDSATGAFVHGTEDDVEQVSSR